MGAKGSVKSSQCPTCGAPVSRFVTECPFCGADVRRRSRFKALKLRLQHRFKGLTEERFLQAGRARSKRDRVRRMGVSRKDVAEPGDLATRDRPRGRQARIKRDRGSRASDRGEGRLGGLKIPDVAGQTPYAVGFLILANIFAFIAFRIQGPLASDPGVLSVDAVRAGEWWRVFTYQFLQSGIFELLFAVLLMALFAILIEARYGHVATVCGYLGAGVLGAIVTVLAGSSTVVTGSLTSTMGLMGMWLVSSARPRSYSESYPLPAGLILVAVMLLYGGFSQNVNLLGEIGGLAFGLALAVLLEIVPGRRRAM